ncbi:MAG: ROK family protein [Chloroflexi bacterium]|nr:ROK family protein [Chloroflexota bacterium]
MADRPALYGALDLGGTKVRALVADLQGQVYGEDIRPSRTEEGLEAVLTRMVESLVAAAAQAGAKLSELKGVGIASPGAVDVRRGVVPSAPQLPGWHEVPLVEIMSGRLGVRVWLENDATAAALGEHAFGGGQGTLHMLYLTVSTGVGGGIIVDGKLYRGKSGAAGELGHVMIDPHGPPCGCGARGCLEAFASGTAIARRGEELVAGGESQVLAELRGREGPVTAEMMKRAVDLGDVASREAFRLAGHYLGIALASYVNIFNPEVILIGGGVARAGDLLMEQARTTMQALAMSQPLKDVRLDLGVLGDRAGSLGMIARMREAVAGGR